MALSIISSITSVIASLLGITAIIVFHEFGHFVFCKLFNVYTPTFSIGMGKVLLSKKIGHTDFCISAAPIGGYVEIATEEGIKGTKGFNQIPYYQKFLIMLGGIFCNFLLTYLIFAGLFFTGIPESGMPYEVNKPIVSTVSSESINHHHLKANDSFITINNKPVNNDTSIIKKEIAEKIKLKEKQIHATVMRNSINQSVLININTEQQTLSKLLDITFEKKAPLGLKESFIQAYSLTTFCLSSIITSLKQLFTSGAGQGFVGPIMAIAVSSKSAQKGFSYLLLLLAIISINLGFMNLLPLPIFDGGQFVIFTIEAITRRKLSEKVQNMIGVSSWVLAIGLLVIFSLKDLHSLIFG